MKKNSAVILVVLLLLSFLSGCAKYKESDFLGKTSAQIESEFGSFDCILMPISEDGLYRNCRCGYTIREASPGFGDKEPEILFFIAFDGNGIAYEASEGYRPGN